MHSSIAFLAAAFFGSAIAAPYYASVNTTTTTPTSTPTGANTTTHRTTYEPVPVPTTKTRVETKTYNTVITTFVPCSTIAATSGTKTYYSTSLTLSTYTTQICEPTTIVDVILPTSGPQVTAGPGAANGACPPVQTVYSTVYVTVGSGSGSGPAVPVPTSGPAAPAGPIVPGAPGPAGCNCHYEIITKETGEIVTITVPNGPSPPNPTGSAPVPPKNGTSSYSKGSPKPTTLKLF